MKTKFDKCIKIREKVYSFITKYNMISNGDKLLIGLSGGADSVCLFSLLLSFRERLGFSFEAVHINHMLRDTAQRDEDYVRKLCHDHNVTLHVEKINVNDLVKTGKLSLEEAGRKARYEAFEMIREKSGIDKIAVAHHENDQAETILFHLCRGTGVEGLCGIRPVRDHIIRPLLCLSRSEIEEYVKEQDLAYVTDETNSENTYSRNFLRNCILPELDEHICHDTVKHMAKTAELTQNAFEFLTDQTERAYQECVTCNSKNVSKGTDLNELILSLKSYEKLHPFLQNEIIRKCLFVLAGSKKDISGVHIEAVSRLSTQQVGCFLNLPYQIVAERSYGTIIFHKKTSKDRSDLKNLKKEVVEQILIEDKDVIEDNKVFHLPDGRKLSIHVFPYQKDGKLPIKAYTKWFDYDKIETPLMLRSPKEGDFFFFDDKNQKFVKDYMVNEKIPANERKDCLLIASDSHMLYFLGRRISNFYKVTENTEQILEITIQEDE